MKKTGYDKNRMVGGIIEYCCFSRSWSFSNRPLGIGYDSFCDFIVCDYIVVKGIYPTVIGKEI
jgi:hypothetical protein